MIKTEVLVERFSPFTSQSALSQSNKHACCAPVSFCVVFDSDPSSTVSDAFRGVESFASPSQVVVHLVKSLFTTTFGELTAEIMSSIQRLHPDLTQHTTRALLFRAEGMSRSMEECSSHYPWLRIDTRINAKDILSNFFVPAPNNRPAMYDIVLQWAPFSRPGNSYGSTAQGVYNFDFCSPGQQTCRGCPPALPDPLLPLPIIYPFTHRCVYTRLMPRADPKDDDGSCDAALDSASCSTSPKLTAWEAASRERGALADEESRARKTIEEIQRSVRMDLSEWEADERRRIVSFLRLISGNDESIPLCGLLPECLITVPRAYPVDTVPLVNPRDSSDIMDLIQCSEETARLSHLFVKYHACGSAVAAARRKQQIIQNVGADGTEVGNAAVADMGSMEEEIDAIDETGQKLSAAEEELMCHFFDVRRDLLMWERKEFRTLTARMRQFLQEQSALEQEATVRLIEEELASAGMLNCGAYGSNHEQTMLGSLAQSAKAHDGTITATCSLQGVTHAENDASFPIPETDGAAAAGANNPPSADPSPSVEINAETYHMIPASPHPDAEPPSDRVSLVQRALGVISRIESRWFVPLPVKQAQQRLEIEESSVRQKLVSEEEFYWEEIVDLARQDIIDTEERKLRAYCELIAPVVEMEQAGRDAICEHESRVLSLLMSLFYRSKEALEAESQ
ncbi:hypothetical protein TRVL_01097 [Trypanosoma vivax]|nr:hypothetical protein TRVL_01097 [Trypanosoma vivax]